jgi:hypothetical protein
LQQISTLTTYKHLLVVRFKMQPYDTDKTPKPVAVLNCFSSILLQLMHCFKSIWLLSQLFCRSMSICHRQTFPESEMLLPVGVLLSYLKGYLLWYVFNKRFTNSKLIRSEIIFENDHILCSWIHNVCKYAVLRTWLNSGLASRVI